MTYLFLAIAIVTEVFATTMLKMSDSFTRPLPGLLSVCGYSLSFFALSFALRVMSTGVAYAIWSGVGIVLISAISWVVFRQALDAPAMIGLGLIIAGVVVVNLFSHTVSH
ncbi:DMT family transporter [Swaminathania salitolerans]|uniref:Multidrug SMR transporter n=1 Tax=Swaminathania salitolerans TaxID=182838 RepID=A0A511BPZ0_9PROT|nr:multidrug efflux SMR transporter [Swaminathania salitolerans]GBQ14863.1 quaternary ammonium compound resistance protein [Swaminathania salitolerans LMG 21291]GEL01913.1 multidrug SMR transporter [Swaminathania salitolerans]